MSGDSDNGSNDSGDGSDGTHTPPHNTTNNQTEIQGVTLTWLGWR